MSLYDIDIKELTDNVVISSDNEVSGSGIFDTLMVTVSKHIEAQYREGRILGTEYSNVYLGALQAVLDLSTKILLEKDLIAKQAEEIDSRISVNTKQVDKLSYETNTLLPSQNTLITAQTTNEGKKGNLIDYQRHGFKVDATYKNVKSLLDTWTIYYSITPGTENILESIKKPTLDNTVNTLTNVINQFPSV